MNEEQGLKKSLDFKDLVFMGLGCIVVSGVFVILGKTIFGYGYIWRRFRKGESPKKIETPQTLSGIGIEHKLFYDEKVVKVNLNTNQVLKKYDSINDIPIPFMSKIDVYQSIVTNKGHEWQFEKDYLRNSNS